METEQGAAKRPVRGGLCKKCGIRGKKAIVTMANNLFMAAQNRHRESLSEKRGDRHGNYYWDTFTVLSDESFGKNKV